MLLLPKSLRWLIRSWNKPYVVWTNEFEFDNVSFTADGKMTYLGRWHWELYIDEKNIVVHRMSNSKVWMCGAENALRLINNVIQMIWGTQAHTKYLFLNAERGKTRKQRQLFDRVSQWSHHCRFIQCKCEMDHPTRMIRTPTCNI